MNYKPFRIISIPLYPEHCSFTINPPGEEHTVSFIGNDRNSYQAGN